MYVSLAPELQKLETFGEAQWEDDSLLTGEELEEIKELAGVLEIVRKASRQLEASKVPTISRCSPTIITILDMLDDFINRRNIQAPEKWISKAIMVFEWGRCSDAITSCSWMAVTMALSPRFADLYVVRRALQLARKHDLGTVPQVSPEQLDDEMASLRLQVILRIVHECKYSAALGEKSLEGDVSEKDLHSPFTAELEISEDEE